MHTHFVCNGFHLLCIQSVFLMHLLLLLQMGIARCRSRLAQNLAWQPSVKAHICVVFFLESATFLHYFVYIHILQSTRVVFEVGQPYIKVKNNGGCLLLRKNWPRTTLPHKFFVCISFLIYLYYMYKSFQILYFLHLFPISKNFIYQKGFVYRRNVGQT